MKKNYRKGLLLLVYITTALLWALPVYGEEGAVDPGSFTYNVVHPENQQSNVGYFNLRMQPGQKQTVQIELTNPSEEKEVTVGASINTVKTNGNGVLEYGPSAIENDESLKYNFSDIVKGAEKVTLAPGETKPLDLEITMPAESYDGVVAGGIQLRVIPTDEEEAAMKSQQGVINKFVYLVGMLLTETDAPVEGELSFNKFYPGLNNFRNAIFADFSNINMAFMSDITVDMQVMKKGSDEVLYDTKKADMKMAPNSKIDFPLIMSGDEMEAGEYTGHLLVTSGDRKWEWTESFTITQEDADKYNKQDVTLTQERGINWVVIAAIVGGVLGLLVIIFIIVRVVNSKKKKKKRESKKKNTKQTDRPKK